MDWLKKRLGMVLQEWEEMEKLQEKNWSVRHAEKEVWEETEEMLR